MQDEVLILGGGVAGCAASIALARKGRSVTLIEREPTSRHKVCGEFLSGEALEDLHALGIDVALAWRHAHRLRSPRRCPARRGGSFAFSRSLAHAQGAGYSAHRRGYRRRSSRRARPQCADARFATQATSGRATLDDGTTYEAPTVFLATGKHDLRGYARPKDPERWVAFKMYFRLAPRRPLNSRAPLN